jgi:hypothetical protein
MTNVQIAIRDRGYAEELRRLLLADGQHQVHIVECPTPLIDGVVVVDSTDIARLQLPQGSDLRRCVVFARTDLDANGLWESGVRHVIHAEYPPQVGHLVVIAAETRLNRDAPDGQGSKVPGLPGSAGQVQTESEPWMFDPADTLFLQTLRISVR